MSYLENAKKIRLIIESAMDGVDDATALEAPTLSKYWSPGETVVPGDRRYYPPTEKLYKVREGQGHITQEDWTPDITPALWSVVTISQAGTIDDPIDAVRGMEYEYGLYYLDPEDSRIYICERIGEVSGGKVILQYLPHELVGTYFTEVVE